MRQTPAILPGREPCTETALRPSRAYQIPPTGLLT
jgi:hypothetical protein